jgi:hypothetical protein
MGGDLDEGVAEPVKAPPKSMMARRLEKEGGKGMKKLSAFFGGGGAKK